MASHTLCLKRLEYLRANAKGADRELADYVLLHPAALPAMTLNALAENTHTSYATVCRFLRKLDVSGFRELKRQLASETAEQPTELAGAPNFGLDGQEELLSYAQINQKIREFSASVIDSCCRTTAPQLAEQVCELLRTAESVYFVGLGTSAITAQYAYTKFFRLKTACAFDADIIIAKMKASLMKKGQVLFAVSSSGRTKSIVEIARLARGSGAAVISLCDFAHSPLANVSDISICTTVRESNKYIDMDFPLIQGQITIIDILYASLYNVTRQRASLSFQRTTEAASSDKLRTP